MGTRYVIVEDYNPIWKEKFKKIKNELLTALSGQVPTWRESNQ